MPKSKSRNLNSQSVFGIKSSSWFSSVNPFNYHSNAPSKNNFIYSYSFALKPEEHQPSGTCNFSRIDNATLSVSAGANCTVCKVFAVNYNVLRVMSGMGGLAYSN